MIVKVSKYRKSASYNVVCDLCSSVCVTTEESIREARFQAKGWDWKRVDGKDMCDLCVAFAAETKESA
jgi:transketolase N-terminal domain/subunit